MYSYRSLKKLSVALFLGEIVFISEYDLFFALCIVVMRIVNYSTVNFAGGGMSEKICKLNLCLVLCLKGKEELGARFKC